MTSCIILTKYIQCGACFEVPTVNMNSTQTAGITSPASVTESLRAIKQLSCIFSFIVSERVATHILTATCRSVPQPPPAPVLYVWRLTCNHSSCHCHYWKSSCKTSRRRKAVIIVQIIMLVSESWWPLTCSTNSVSCAHCLPGDPSVQLGSMVEVGQENLLLLSGKVQ